MQFHFIGGRAFAADVELFYSDFSQGPLKVLLNYQHAHRYAIYWQIGETNTMSHQSVFTFSVSGPRIFLCLTPVVFLFVLSGVKRRALECQ